MFGRPVASAIFIDFDNVGSGELRGSIARWTAWLEDGAFAPARRRRRRFLVKRVYWNGRSDQHRQEFEAAGFEAFACRPVAANKQFSNESAVDLRIAIDVVDVLHRYRSKGLKEVVLFTTDTDFVPLVNLAREAGLRVMTLGNEADSSSAIYRDHADAVIGLRELRAGFGYERARRGWAGVWRLAGKPAPAPDPDPDPVGLSAPAPDRRAPLNRIARAAEAIIKAAEATPTQAVGRKRVIKILGRALPGFATFGPRAWLGKGSYERMMDAILAARPDKLKARPDANGGRTFVLAE